MLYTLFNRCSETVCKSHLIAHNHSQYFTRSFASLYTCPGSVRAPWACSSSSTSRCHSLAQTTIASAQPSVPPAEVTILIKECSDFESLQEVIQEHQPYFNIIHAAAAFTHAAQLSQELLQGQPAAAQQLQQDNSNGSEFSQQQQQQQQQHWQALSKALPLLLAAVQQQCSNFQGRQVANCVWAANKFLHALQMAQQQQVPLQQQQQQAGQSTEALPGVQQQLLKLIQQLLEQTQHCWHLFTGQELVLLLYAVASMPCVAAAAVASGTANASISLDNSHAEAETLYGTASNQGLTGAASGGPLSSAAMTASSSRSSPSSLSSSLASRAAEGNAAISLAWANHTLHQLQRLHRSGRLRLKPQEFEMLLISLRRLRQQSQQQQQQQQLHLPMALLQQLLTAAADRSHKCSSRDIAGILYSVTALNIRFSSSVTAKLLAPLSPGSRYLRSCSRLDVTNILYALAALKYRPWQHQQQQQLLRSELAFKGLVTLLLQQRQQFPPAELAVSLYALGRLRVRLPAAAADALAAAAVTGLRPVQQQELVLVCWGLASSGSKPRPVLLQALLAKYLRGMAAAAQDSTTAAAADDVEQTSSQNLQQTMASQHVAMLLWSLGRFRYCPPRLLLLPLLQLSHLLLPHAAPEHLACTCWGLARIEIRPSKVWLSGFYKQLLWHMQPQSPEPLTELAGAGTAGVEALVNVPLSVKKTQITPGPCNGQILAMILWGLVRMQETGGDQDSSTAVSAAAAALQQPSRQSATSVPHVLAAVVQASQSIMTQSPVSVGVMLWGFVKLGFHPDPDVLQTALQALLGVQQQRGQQKGRQQQQQQQQQQQRLTVQQQRRHAQSLSLTVWSLAKLGAADEQKQLLMEVLWANVQQVKFMNLTDLTAIIWGLNKLQLRPPNPWLLNFYTCSQSQFEQCTDLRLASLIVPLYELLQRQAYPPGDAQPQQQSGQVPPAVWQLQLELQVNSRWKRRKRRRLKQRTGRQGAAADAEGMVLNQTAGQLQPAQGHESGSRQRIYDPLRVVSKTLSRWRAVSVGSSASAAAQQLPVERPALV